MAPQIPAGTKITGLQTLMSRANQAWDILLGRTFNPGVPLVPVSNKEEQQGGPRATQFPVSANIVIQPRSEYPELTPMSQLRNLARLYDVAALCVATKSEEVSSIDWSIVAKDKKQQQVLEDSGAIGRVTDFWESPDRLNEFPSWLMMALRDVLEIDALTLYPRRTRNGGLYALEVVDGATIKPLIDDRGRALAYQQIIYGFPYSQYRRYGVNAPDEMLPLFNSDGSPVTNELIYRPRYAHTDGPYGFSPTEFIIMRINMALRKQTFDLSYFTDGNLPEMLLSPPSGTLNPEQVAQFEADFNAVLSGSDAARRRAKIFPWPLNPQIMKEFSYDTILDEWMMKLTCAAYGVTPSELGFTDDVNRATADSQQNVQYRKGIKPLCKWLKKLFDRIIARELGEPGLEFQWHFDEAEDTLTQSQVDDTYMKDGVLSPDEVRTMRFAGKVEGKAPGIPGQAASSGAATSGQAAPGNSSTSTPAAGDSGDGSDQEIGNVIDATGSSDADSDDNSDNDDEDTADVGKLAITDFEKKGQGRKKGPGSRGGKFWIDNKGHVRYGKPPVGTKARSPQQWKAAENSQASKELKGIKTFDDLKNLDGWEYGVAGPQTDSDGYSHFGSDKAAALQAANDGAKEHPDMTYAVMQVDGNYVLAAKDSSDLQKDVIANDQDQSDKKSAKDSTSVIDTTPDNTGSSSSDATSSSEPTPKKITEQVTEQPAPKAAPAKPSAGTSDRNKLQDQVVNQNPKLSFKQVPANGASSKPKPTRKPRQRRSKKK